MSFTQADAENYRKDFFLWNCIFLYLFPNGIRSIVVLLPGCPFTFPPISLFSPLFPQTLGPICWLWRKSPTCYVNSWVKLKRRPTVLLKRRQVEFSGNIGAKCNPKKKKKRKSWCPYFSDNNILFYFLWICLANASQSCPILDRRLKFSGCKFRRNRFH